MPAVSRAKQLRNAIIELMDGSDLLNSPAQGTRTEATGMGGESGESSGGFDDDDDDIHEYEDTGVENAPTERTIVSSDAPTGDEQAPRLPVPSTGQRGSTARREAMDISSTANSSNNRRRTLKHNTPISWPRNRQRENSPEDPGDRVGNVMVMMMMSQAQDRDERQEEHEERCHSGFKSRCSVSRCKISRT